MDRLSRGHSSVKAQSCFWLCVRVCPPACISTLFCLLHWPFSQHITRKMGLCAADTLDHALITANNRQFELRGLYFFVIARLIDWLICHGLQCFSNSAFCVFRKVKAKAGFQTFAVISNKCTCTLDSLHRKTLHCVAEHFCGLPRTARRLWKLKVACYHFLSVYLCRDSWLPWQELWQQHSWLRASDAAWLYSSLPFLPSSYFFSPPSLFFCSMLPSSS